MGLWLGILLARWPVVGIFQDVVVVRQVQAFLSFTNYKTIFPRLQLKTEDGHMVPYSDVPYFDIS